MCPEAAASQPQPAAGSAIFFFSTELPSVRKSPGAGQVKLVTTGNTGQAPCNHPLHLAADRRPPGSGLAMGQATAAGAFIWHLCST